MAGFAAWACGVELLHPVRARATPKAAIAALDAELIDVMSTPANCRWANSVWRQV
jgi:hypothetical protein